MRSSFLRLTGFFAIALLAVAPGCSKPKEGQKCDSAGQTPGNMKGTCLSKTAALVCIGDVYQEVKCEKGAVGCMETMGSVSCDVLRDEGEPCMGDKEWGCSSDHKKMLKCKKGKWKLEMACKSAKGCIDNVKGVSCESAEADEGDKCKADQKGSGSCNPEKNKLLVCDGKKMVVASTCRGQNKCRASGSKLECDTSLAEIDDPCTKDGKMACDVAKKALLKCDGKTFQKDKDCKKRCNNAFDDYSCD